MITNLATARAALKAALLSAADRFPDPEGLDALLQRSLLDVSRDAPRWRLHEMALQAGVATYPAPADAHRVGVLFWGPSERIPQWSPEYAGPAPRARLVKTDAEPTLELDPPPTARQIQRWGATGTIRLGHPQELTAETTTLTPMQGRALILRAQAEAMKTLAASGVVTPIQRHQGMGASQPGNSTPAALAEQFMAEYREVIRVHSI